MSVSPYLPPAAADGSAPEVAAYHPTEYDPAHCAARDTAVDTHEDRRWAPFVYMTFQCKNAPVSGTDLCSKCTRHATKFAIATTAQEQRASMWHGRVNESLDTLPAVSHMAGSEWFHKKAKWIGAPKPPTAKQAGHHEKRQLVKDVDLVHFVRGEMELPIERLVADNQITGQQLRDMWCMLRGVPTGAKSAGKFDTKQKLCAEIRRLMAAPVPAAVPAEAPVLEVIENEVAPAAPVKVKACLLGPGGARAKKPGRAELRAALAAKDAELTGVHAALAAAMDRIAALEAAAAAKKELMAQLLAAL